MGEKDMMEIVEIQIAAQKRFSGHPGIIVFDKTFYTI
jgi:hypothetical protein